MEKPTVEEVRAEYMRRKGSPNRKSEITLMELAAEMGYSEEEFKRALVEAEQHSTHVSKSPSRNRRRAKRQELMRHRFELCKAKDEFDAMEKAAFYSGQYACQVMNGDA